MNKYSTKENDENFKRKTEIENSQTDTKQMTSSTYKF